MSTPLLDTSGSVHIERLKQHGLLLPARSFEKATLGGRLRVSAFLVERIQRIQSQRAIGAISFQSERVSGCAARPISMSISTLGTIEF